VSRDGATISEAWDRFNRSGEVPVRERFQPTERILEQWLDASVVVVDYIKTGGQNVVNGGLPTLD
jgi:hypothetical protein